MFLFSLAAEGEKAVSESVNSRGRRRSMWACAFRATFISSISFIHLLYSYSFSEHCHSLHRETFEGGGTESFSETCCPKPCAFTTHATRQSHARSHVRLLRTPRANLTPSRHPSVRGRTNWAAYTHTHTSSSVRKSNHASGNTSICGSA